MLKKIIALLLSVLVIVTAFALPTFAAEDEAATVAEESYQYAMNLIPFPYTETSLTRNGVTFTVQEDGGIYVKGTSTATVSFRLSGALYLKAEEYYTVSGGVTANPRKGTDAIIVNARKKTIDSADEKWIESSSSNYQTGATGMLGTDEYVVYCSIYIASGKTVDGTVYPMLNVGQKAYSYTLYLPYLLEQQYNNGYTNGETIGSQNGYDQGYTEGNQAGYDKGYVEGEAAGSTSGYEQGYTEGNQAGYDKGYTDGVSSGIIQGTDEGYKSGYQAAVDMIGAEVMNPFAAASLTVKVEGSVLPSSWEYEYEVPITLTADGALSINACIDYVKSKVATWYPDTDLTNANYTLTFSWVDQAAGVGAFDCESSLFAYKGVTGVVTSSMLFASYDGFVGGTQKVYSPLIVSNGSGTFLFDIGTIEGFTLSDLKVFYQDLSANYSADLYLYAVSTVKSPLYNVGYTDGFLEGQKSSLEDVGQIFYDQGYNVGFTNGKKEGLTIAETGDWRTLILAVTEAPINTFQSLFNFEILGMDMRAAFGSILAVCVVLIIVKKVVL